MRQLVGGKYLDMLHVSDTITEMNKEFSSITSSVLDIINVFSFLYYNVCRSVLIWMKTMCMFRNPLQIVRKLVQTHYGKDMIKMKCLNWQKTSRSSIHSVQLFSLYKCSSIQVFLFIQRIQFDISRDFCQKVRSSDSHTVFAF